VPLNPFGTAVEVLFVKSAEAQSHDAFRLGDNFTCHPYEVRQHKEVNDTDQVQALAAEYALACHSGHPSSRAIDATISSRCPANSAVFFFFNSRFFLYCWPAKVLLADSLLRVNVTCC